MPFFGQNNGLELEKWVGYEVHIVCEREGEFGLYLTKYSHQYAQDCSLEEPNGQPRLEFDFFSSVGLRTQRERRWPVEEAARQKLQKPNKAKMKASGCREMESLLVARAKTHLLWCQTHSNRKQYEELELGWQLCDFCFELQWLTEGAKSILLSTPHAIFLHLDGFSPCLRCVFCK